MDHSPIRHLTGERLILLLADGNRIEGELLDAEGDWWRIAAGDGEVLVNPAQVAAVASAGALPASSAAPRKRAAATTGGSPGRPWADEDLTALADAFLDGENDKDLAARFGRTPAIVKQLRQGFEAARGNLDEDRISEIARTWIARWREVLTA